MLFDEIVKKDEEYFMPVYGKRFPIAVDYGKGCYIYDTNGKEYIDFASGIATNCLGYDYPGFNDYVKNQLDKICHFSNLYYNEPQAQLAEKLCSYFDESYKAFLCNSGAEANECAIKLVRKHFKNENKHKILSLRNSFHGRTMATLAATGQDKFHKDFTPLCPEFDYFSTAEELAEKADNTVGGIIIELVQGEGGVNTLDEKLIDAIKNICQNKNILLIIDEIQTGIGRTGKMFAHHHYDLSPDIITLAKALGNGLPIGACLAKEHIHFEKGDHGSTFGGNALCCSAANFVLKTVNNDLLTNVNEISDYIFNKLSTLNPRGKGLLIGFNHSTLKNIDIVKACMEKGLLLLTAGNNTVRMAPPLIITKDEADKAIEIIFNSIKELEEK